jgi:hypothetical protein
MDDDLVKEISEIAKMLNDVGYETVILVEEMSELTKVMCKLQRKIMFPSYDKYKKDNVYEEMSHVIISLEICKRLLDIDDNVLNETIRERLAIMKEYRDGIAP